MTEQKVRFSGQAQDLTRNIKNFNRTLLSVSNTGIIWKQKGNLSPNKEETYLLEILHISSNTLLTKKAKFLDFKIYRSNSLTIESIYRGGPRTFSQRDDICIFFDFIFSLFSFALSFYLLIFPFFYFSFLIFVVFNFLFFESFLCFLSSIVFISFHFAFWNEAKWKARGRELV